LEASVCVAPFDDPLALAGSVPSGANKCGADWIAPSLKTVKRAVCWRLRGFNEATAHVWWRKLGQWCGVLEFVRIALFTAQVVIYCIKLGGTAIFDVSEKSVENRLCRE
jgi:hypothetical protein